jgi:hypothetical protein
MTTKYIEIKNYGANTLLGMIAESFELNMPTCIFRKHNTELLNYQFIISCHYADMENVQEEAEHIQLRNYIIFNSDNKLVGGM